MNTLFIALILVQCAVLIYLVYKRQGRFLIVFPALLFISALYTWIGWRFFSFSVDMPFDFLRHARADNVEKAIIYFIVCAGAFALGSLLVRDNSAARAGTELPNKLVVTLGNLGQMQLLATAAIWFVVFIPSYGLDNLLQRTLYRPEFAFQIGMVIASIVLPFSSLAIGLLRNRFVRMALLIAAMLIIVATSSRSSLVLIAFYLIGTFMRKGRIVKTELAVFAFLALWLSAFALESRHLPVQGIMPNFLALLAWFDIDAVVYTINYILSFSVGVLTYAIEMPYHLVNVVPYSLSPLPSFLYSIPVTFDNLIGTAPYSAMAILYNESYWGGVVFFFVCGFLIAVMERYSYQRNFFLWVIISSFIFVFTILCVQYQLRSAARLVYYMMFFSALYTFGMPVIRKMFFTERIGHV
ncbi:hypothetical protein [Modicisalibacter xianhensis]|uniref:Oligosaccharide repeat unit polymerase n=1 Tax=Modicisalibacter xianhensis TaxID=442341 RepID=A0A1I2ZE39_9GAMM|nr:hypothetical protein [Halomonas xianhensis]SFH36142.1 hypothetical protein SAMN04487959_10370 [Halomonas xianhensis]